MRFLRGVIILFCIFYLRFTVHGQVELERGLIGCYPFSGNAKDFSPLANHGQVTGARLADDRFGNTNSAYEFDGLNDVIEISPAALQINTFTYSIWVNPSLIPTPTTAQFLFSVGSDYGDQHILYGDHYSNDRHTGFSHGSYLGVADNILCSGPAVEPTGQWYHLVLVKDDKNYYFYVNGRMVCSNSANGKKAFYGTSTVRATIGTRNNYGQASHARIDDIHLYDRPLNEEEIEALYKGANIPSVPATGHVEVNKNQICGGETVSLKVVSDKPGSVFKWQVDGVERSESSSELILQTVDRGSEYRMNIQVAIEFDSTCFTQPSPLALDRSLDVRACVNPPKETTRPWVPDIFTPNRDGKNDNWKIFNAESIQELRIFVYNRWGEVIYYSKDYSHNWDGTYRGKLVPAGSYVFKILSGKKLITEGSVMVVY
ncbi:gliding motility-associated C-terminal domain-containing protein [Dyadobacter sp. CY261]|uniref:LamG-like jellyroll fold domain-containing protein n=1 Tax=Dyadobacter sp. CY261 TaxID=2907203 RepID=UPI001F15E05B|nr:LamG-like jellyroll fold domain-containing protein [Dyadobacter sp. CY261]MCF0073415.1 gliding motility-associated C-terminal domain-containing protein [Dyadobacter sp. CY261]